MQGGQHASGAAKPKLPPGVVAYLATLSNVASGQAKGSHLPGEFEALWGTLDASSRSVLVRHPQLWTNLRAILGQFETLFDVRQAVLAQVAMDAEARQQSAQTGFTSILADAVLSKAMGAKHEKHVERVTLTATTLALLALDAPVVSNAAWVLQLSLSTKDALERSQSRPGAQFEAYCMLNVFIKLIYISTDSPLCALIASTFVNSAHGGVALLFQVSRALLTLADQSKGALRGGGLPKIIAEKALLVLSKLHAEFPSIVPDQLPAAKLAKFLVLVARDSNWVQSQDIAIVFFARLLFLQRSLSVALLDNADVLDMLRALLRVKSNALRMTAVAFVSLCPPEVFYQLAAEFDAALTTMSALAYRSLKAALYEVGRGVWGLPCALSLPATSALMSSDFTRIIGEDTPAVVPRLLWPLLPGELQAGVAALQGVPDWGAEKERQLAGATGRPVMSDVGGRAPGGGAGAAGPSPAYADGVGTEGAGGGAGFGFARQPSDGGGALYGGGGAHGGHGAPPPACPHGGHGSLRPPAWETNGGGGSAHHHAHAHDHHDGGGGGGGAGGARGLAPRASAKRPPALDTFQSDAFQYGDQDEDYVEDDNPKPSKSRKSGVLFSTAATAMAAVAGSSKAVPRGQRYSVAVPPILKPRESQHQHQPARSPGAPARSPAGHPATGGFGFGFGGGGFGSGGAGAAGGGAPLGGSVSSAPGGAADAGARRRKQVSYAALNSGLDASHAPGRRGYQSAPALRPPQPLLSTLHLVPRLPDPLSAAVAARTAAAAAGAPPACAPPALDDVAELNSALDAMWGARQSGGGGADDARMSKLLVNMATGAANISMVQYLRSFPLIPGSAIVDGLDGKLATLRARAQLVCSGCLSGEGLDLLLPFSELLLAETGEMRRRLEAAAGDRSSGGGGGLSVYYGGENVRFAMY